MLGPTLFTIYINDIDENINSQILKFADDTKLMTPVSNQEQITELQDDLANAFHWAGKWQMEFNPGKCKCVGLHLGRSCKPKTRVLYNGSTEDCEQVKDEHHRFTQEPSHILRTLRTSLAITQPKGHRQPGRSSEEMTKMVNGMGEDEYNLRLSKTKLLSLEIRRLRSDLIEVFKIMHNLEGVKREDFFQLRTATGQRGRSLTILK